MFALKLADDGINTDSNKKGTTQDAMNNNENYCTTDYFHGLLLYLPGVYGE